jgi:hypothetical protein
MNDCLNSIIENNVKIINGYTVLNNCVKIKKNDNNNDFSIKIEIKSTQSLNSEQRNYDINIEKNFNELIKDENKLYNFINCYYSNNSCTEIDPDTLKFSIMFYYSLVEYILKNISINDSCSKLLTTINPQLKFLFIKIKNEYGGLRDIADRFYLTNNDVSGGKRSKRRTKRRKNKRKKNRSRRW